jgi:hypothetical protein
MAMMTVLSNANKHYFVPDQVWRCKTKEEKEKIFTNFMKDNRKKRTAGMMASPDGTYSVINKAKSLAKKPCQRKRPTAESPCKTLDFYSREIK